MTLSAPFVSPVPLKSAAQAVALALIIRARLTKKASPTALPTDVQQLRDQWMQCTAAAAKADLRGSRPAEDVADAALQRCRAQEPPLARALSRQLGKAGAERVVEQLRETDRSNLIRAIEELRAKPE